MHGSDMAEWTWGVSTTHPGHHFGQILQVYRIFTLHTGIEPTAHTSELAHFLYTAAILLPNIVILTVWTAVDPHCTDDTFVEHPGFIIIEEKYKSDYTFVWFQLLLIYHIV